ncbi:MAG TPA: type VI secretion system baseplate subunit TssK [Gammaproteobacteria bacterium]
MSWKNKIIWSEGLFLRPHHFQQHDRYLEDYVEGRSRALRNHSWGFTELTLDKDQLAIGKLVIASAQGVFPDGTPFNIPDDDRPPPALELAATVRDTRVYLAVPIRRLGGTDVGAEQREGLARHVPRDFETGDSTGESQSSAVLRVGTLRTRLLLDSDRRDEYACLGVAQVVEVRTDRSVVLQKEYVPPMLDYRVSAFLAGFLSELRGLVRQRADELAGRVTASGRGGAAEISEFLFLQALNRYEPLIVHLAGLAGVHPEDVYRPLLEMAGELATFTSQSKRPPALPEYRHDDLRATFAPLIAALRESLGTIIEAKAIQIPLKEPRYGIRAGLLADRTLVGSANFVLAVRADVPTEEIRSHFPAQTKIGSVEKIGALVQSQLPGIPLRALPVAPRQIPYHADYVYFELDRASDYWANLKDSGGFAIHVGGDIHGLDLQLWAIRK